MKLMSWCRRRTGRGSTLVVAWLAAAALSYADAPQTGLVTGTVRTQDGTPAAGATVQLIGPRETQSAISDEEGRFRFAAVLPGAYKVRGELEGLQPAEANVVVSAGVRADADLELSMAIREEVSVTAEAPLISKYEASVATTVQAEVAEELVFNTRTYRSELLMFPGVVRWVDKGDRTVSVHGGNGAEMSSFIDGVDVSVTRFGGTTRLFLPTTALSEVRVDGSGYGAEYGRVTGGINSAVTKSGSNMFHGDFLYVAQNPAWTAQSEHVPLEQPDDLQGQIELSLGGRLVRDKAFFFASASETSTNELTHLASGEVVDDSLSVSPRLLKLDINPTPSHRVAITGVSAPLEQPTVSTSLYYDRTNISLLQQDQGLLTGSWSWVISGGLFLELRGAAQRGPEERVPLSLPQVDPSESPDDPRGNTSLYIDLRAPAGYHRGVGVALGGLDFPRDQGNAILTWFKGAHEVKLGVDYQNPVMETAFEQPPVYRGLGYDENLPGGYQVPQSKRIYYPVDEPVRTESEVLNGFLQDRFDVGDHWALVTGLRFEDQRHMNDRGETVVSSSDVAPRLAAIYDVHADGKLLVKATAGRYYSLIYQNIINTQFSTSSTGNNAYDQYLWNRATGLYDRYQQTVLPAGTTAEGGSQLDPYYKDEVTIGFDRQLGPIWALTTRAIYWQDDDQWAAQEQFDANGDVYTVVWNVPGVKREYAGLQLELNRSFRQGWVLRSIYTLSRLKSNDSATFKEGFRAVDPESGVPITAINRWGPADGDRNHILNVAGSKSFPVGRHSLQLGGYYRFISGEAWNLEEAVTLDLEPNDPTSPTINSTYYIEPPGTHRLPGTHTLNLNGTWRFPIASKLEGSLRLEVVNVTDEQRQTRVNETTGQPTLTRAFFQLPREFRVVVGARF